jgi:hypothetical protein
MTPASWRDFSRICVVARRLLLMAKMTPKRRRLVIVRRGNTALFRELKARFADDAATRVIWDRRAADRRIAHSSLDRERRRARRRFPHDPVVLAARGYYVTYAAASAVTRV